MIGLGFLFRVLQFAFYLVIAGIGLVAFVWLVNILVQLVAKWLGLAVMDFWEWFPIKFKLKKK